MEVHERTNPLEIHERSISDSDGRTRNRLPTKQEHHPSRIIILVGIFMIIGVVTISLIIKNGSVSSIKEQIRPLALSMSSNICGPVSYTFDFQEKLNTVNFNSFDRGEIQFIDDKFTDISHEIMVQMVNAADKKVSRLYAAVPCDDKYCLIGASLQNEEQILWLVDESTSHKRHNFQVDEFGKIIKDLGEISFDPITSRPWFKIAKETKSGEFGQSEPYLDFYTKKWSISIVLPHFDDDDNISSIFVVDVELDQFNIPLKNVVNSIDSKGGILVSIIDSDERIYAISDDGIAKKLEDTTDHLLKASEIDSDVLSFGMKELRRMVPDLNDFPDKAVLDLDSDLEYVIVGERLSNANGFISLLIIPRDDFYMYISQCTKIISIVTFVIVSLVAGAVFFFTWMNAKRQKRKTKSYSVIYDSGFAGGDEQTNW
eukprot:TRINITY_DN1119_c0_g1_i2.p1 TRINITY_DN1119_c0_g1~~TRINITY_DN1119_c0_g1_i2.p1  ORF type:complete len:429 (+),score=103.55 TRINITY_DN1119_c0_g1_i2:80-1366(+)